MSFIELLETNENEIIEDAVAALARTPLKRYKESGLEINRERLRKLYALTVQSIKNKNLVPLLEYIQGAARDRFNAGYPVYEVLTAINILEETVWNRIVKELEPAELADSVGSVSTVLGAAKTSLASTYVSLASKTKSPSLDLSALFKGTDQVGE